jgi:hypothetical protein
MKSPWPILLLSLVAVAWAVDQVEEAAAAATPLPAWPYSPLGANGSFPALWYGSNQSGMDNPSQLQHDARFSLLFYIWGVGMGQTNWTRQEAMFESQCAAVKATSPQRPCLVYLDWGTALGWYSVQADAASDPALDQIWLKDKAGKRLGFTDCHDPNCPIDLLLDFRKAAAIDWWVERVVEPLLTASAVYSCGRRVFRFSRPHRRLRRTPGWGPAQRALQREYHPLRLVSGASGAASALQRDPPGLALDVKVILTPPCIFH